MVFPAITTSLFVVDRQEYHFCNPANSTFDPAEALAVPFNILLVELFAGNISVDFDITLLQSHGKNAFEQTFEAISMQHAVRVATQYAPAPILPVGAQALARRRADAT